MHNPTQNEAEAQEPKYQKPFSFNEVAETTGQTRISMRDPDTTLSMVVLLLACLALAALAHLVV